MKKELYEFLQSKVVHKKWLTFFIIFLLGFLVKTYGQQVYPVTVNTVVEPPYSPYFEDYFSPASTKWKSIIIFNDFAEPEWDVKLRLTIESSKVRLQTRPDFIPSIPLRAFPGIPLTVTGADLSEYFRVQNLNINGITAQDLNKNGRFPEGFYSFCIEVLDYKTGKLLSTRSCSSFWIQLNDEPITITPICGNVVMPNPTQNIVFQWHQSNAVSPNSLGTEYQVTLYEITDPTVNPLNAIQNNKVLKIFESGFISQNTFIYDMTAPLLDVGKKYTYVVHARDIEGKDQFKNGGKSQPCWFWYGYPAGGMIELEQPALNSSFSMNDPLVFKWKSPSKLLQNQYFNYQIKVVKYDSTQTPEEAILNNPVWYQESSVTTNRLSDYDLLVNKKPDPLTDYAWQVYSYTEGQLIASSPVYTFHGPGVIEEFLAGNHLVQVKSTFNQNLKELSGIAKVTLSADGKTQEVPFYNLRIIKVAGRYVLDYGSISSDLKDTSLIALTPFLQENKNAYFHPKKFRLDKNALEFYGNVTWELPHLLANFEKAYVTSKSDWVSYDKFKVDGHAILNNSNQFTLLDPYQFKLNLFTSSDFLIDDNRFNLRLDGEVVFTNAIKGTDYLKGNVKVPFQQAGQLFYITNAQTSLTNNILPLPNSNMVMAPLSYVIDLSETQSPLKINDNAGWKGVYFSKFRVDFNMDADRFGQLVFVKQVPANYELTSSDSYRSWIDGTGMSFAITKKFGIGDATTFNKFPSVLNTLKIDIQKNQVQNSVLTGSIIIPFISTTQRHTFTCPVSNNGFEAGFLDSLDGLHFTHNKGSGDQEVKLTVTRAVFADKERLDMTLDLDWPSLKVTAQSLTGFKAWGNYEIGFIHPKGAMSFATQLQGFISTYPVTFDGIGAGSSNGAYAFGLTGKAVLAEDVSGHDGPPAINIYSTVFNALLPKDPYVASSDTALVENTIPDAPRQNSYEDNVAIIKDDVVRRLNENSTTVTSDAEASLADGFVSENGQNYDVSEIVSSSQESKKDSSWSHVSIRFDQDALVDEMLTAVTLTLTQPFTDKIRIAVDSQVVKITSRVDKFRDSLNIKVDRQINKLMDSLAAKVIQRLKQENFDPTEQVQTIADTVAHKLSIQVRANISTAIDNNITNPFRSFFQNEITGRTNTFIEGQIRGILNDILNGQISFNSVLNGMADNLPAQLRGMGNDAFAMINMKRMEGTMVNIGRDAMGGVKLTDIDDLLRRAVEAEVSNLVSKAISNKASEVVNSLANNIAGQDGEVSASVGLGVKMNFDNLGRNLKEGKVDKVVKLDAVSVALNTKFVAFAGLIYYSADDPVYGDIWKGGVKLDVKMPKKFSLQGTYVNGRKDEMPYWFCQISGAGSTTKIGEPMDKKAKKLSSAVSLGPVELVAASGRLYHHMTDIPGRAIVPDPNTNFGAGVNFTFFDAASHGRAVRLGVGANVEIKLDGNYVIDFEGDIQMVNLNPQPEVPDLTCSGGGGVSLHYNSAESHFIGKGWVLFQKNFCAKGNFFVETKPGYWNVQIGTREDMIMVTPSCIGWGAAGWIGVNQTTANLGLGLSYSCHTRIGLNVGPVGGGINIDAGIASGINATVQYKPTIKLMQAGIWVDLWANVGIDWHTKIKSGYINLVNVNCKGDLLMTFNPPPTTLRGTVRGHVSVLCFGVDFNAGIEKQL